MTRQWDSLGYQGRNFVATGPHAHELTELNARPAKEPIRIYAGLQSADSTEGRVAVVLSELQRTHAFDRKVLVIIPTTGTGWSIRWLHGPSNRCTTATPRWSRCSTRNCPAGFRFSPTSRRLWTPARR